MIQKCFEENIGKKNALLTFFLFIYGSFKRFCGQGQGSHIVNILSALTLWTLDNTVFSIHILPFFRCL